MSNDQSGGKPPVDSKCVIIPMHLRLESVDTLGCDRSVSNLEFRIYVVIQSHINNQTGETFISHETIAHITGHHIRTVQRAIDQLEKRGFLFITRRDLGTRRSDGRRAFGGRGIANVYRLAIDRILAMATRRGRVLVRRADEVKISAQTHRHDGEKSGHTTAANENKPGHGHRPLLIGSTVSGPEKNGAEAVPTLTDPTDQNSPGRSGIAKSSKAIGLPEEVKLLLRSRSRDANLDFWLCNISEWRIEGGTITLFVPSRFYEDHIRNRYEHDILQCWKRIQPDVAGIRIVTRK
jgi:hypothetical protein